MIGPRIEWCNGYPTDESLVALAGAELEFGEAEDFLRRVLSDCAANCCASYNARLDLRDLSRPKVFLEFSTGGWSGAEDLIEALLRHPVIEMHHLQWQRGGHYVFDFEQPPQTKGAP